MPLTLWTATTDGMWSFEHEFAASRIDDLTPEQCHRIQQALQQHAEVKLRDGSGRVLRHWTPDADRAQRRLHVAECAGEETP